jgi:predicted metal-dependent hydrolase
MEKNIILKDQNISYTLRKSKRARRMRLAVRADGSVVVTTPFRLPEAFAEKFIKEKALWLLSKISFFARKQTNPISRYSRADYIKHKEEARVLVQEKVARFAVVYGVHYNRIAIRNQRNCWGSCSKKQNLNFNYKIIFLSESAQDYVIVHELCHLREFNHSKKFWELVGEQLPDHREIRKELRGLSG